MQLIVALFGIKNESEINFNNKKEDRHEHQSLVKEIEEKLNGYINELGETGYSLFNVITDIASRPIDNRYFRRDANSLQRLAGNWMNSFQKEIQKPNFDMSFYIKTLKESPNEALSLTANRYTTDGR